MSIWCLLRESLQDPPAFLGNKNLHWPRVSRSSGRTAPAIQVTENAKRFCWALEMPGRGRYALKIGISAVFGPKPWDPPRRPENGPPASFNDQPNGLRLAPRPDLDFGPLILRG